MVERLARYEADVRQNERLRTLGQLGAGIAHQIRNAATGARLALDLHRQECPLEPDCETLEVAGRQFTLMESLSAAVPDVGRGEALQLEPLDLGALVEDVLPLVRPACSHARIDLQFERPDGADIAFPATSKRWPQLVINLLTNAIEAAPDRRRPRLARAGRRGPRGVVERDGRVGRFARSATTAPARPPRMSQRLFEPFVSDKPDGTGLGLAVVPTDCRRAHRRVKLAREPTV